MGESDLQATKNSNDKSGEENFDHEASVTTSNIDLSKDLMQSFLKCGNVHDALDVCIGAYSSDFPDSSCLEVFVDGLVENARENLTKYVIFSVDYFLCMCGEVITDPVTLKCGHTFSKKCVLSAMKFEYFDCKKCGKKHSQAYISQLKSNVTISALIEKFWKIQSSEDKIKNDLCSSLSTYSQKNNHIKSSTPSPKNSLKKGDTLVNFEMYEDALKMYLICLTFEPNTIQAKEKAVKLLDKFLLKHQRKVHARNIYQYAITLKNAISKKKRDSALFNENIKNNESKNCNQSVIGDEEACNDEETKDETRIYINDSAEANKLHKILDNFCNYIEDFSGKNIVKNRMDMSCFDKQDFECSLCMRILWEPVSTPCGHTFCRVCLNRCLDHRPTCPLCKASLSNYLAERSQNITEFLELAIKTLLPGEYAERKQIHKEEMEELLNAGKDPEHVIPLFICTIAFPTVPCPLHVFEPRYRLMIRQCMESGSCQFGMCTFIDNNIAEYGTMLKIKDVQYFPDGRSVVDTVGSRRFRILRKGERDGYSTGAVEFLEDEPLDEIDLEDAKEMHDQVYKFSEAWFEQLPRDTKHQILQHFGPMPEIETNYYSSINGPAWFWWMLAILPVEPRSQLMILSMTSLPRRLKTLYRVLLHLQSNIVI